MSIKLKLKYLIEIKNTVPVCGEKDNCLKCYPSLKYLCQKQFLELALTTKSNSRHI